MAEPDRHHAGTAAAGGRVSGAESAGVVKSHRVTESPRVVEPTRVTEPVAPELKRYTPYLMRRAHLHMTSTAERTTVARDYAVLAALADGHAASQLALAERLEINRTVMVRLIDRLQAAGAVTRTRNPDNRRSYLLGLTDAGRAALAAWEPRMRERDRTLTAGLTDAEHERLNELLRVLLGRPEKTPETVSTEHLVTQVFFLMRRSGDAMVAHAGLRLRNFAALFVIDRIGPCPQQEFARCMGLGEPAAALTVDELVDKGLVVRGQDLRDRRRHALELTGLGRDRLGLLTEAVERLQADFVRMLGGREQEAELHALLSRMLAPPRAAGGRPGAVAGRVVAAAPVVP